MDGVVLVAAGASQRFGGSVSKVLRLLAGKPVIVRSIGPFLVAVESFTVVVAAREEDHRQIARLLPRAKLVKGGDTRAESVQNAITSMPASVDVVLVHDAARPLVSAGVVRRVLAAARKHGAAAPVIGVKDSIHRLTGATPDHPALITESLDRAALAAAQTPQGAKLALLKEAFAAAGDDLASATDEVSLLRRAEIPVAAVKGDKRNLKITTPQDLKLAEILLEKE